jgi:hypothetical protein
VANGSGNPLIMGNIMVIRCPACGRFVRAFVYNGHIKGWCAVMGKYVNVPLEKTIDNGTKQAGQRKKYL